MALRCNLHTSQLPHTVIPTQRNSPAPKFPHTETPPHRNTPTPQHPHTANSTHRNSLHLNHHHTPKHPHTATHPHCNPPIHAAPPRINKRTLQRTYTATHPHLNAPTLQRTHTVKTQHRFEFVDVENVRLFGQRPIKGTKSCRMGRSYSYIFEKSKTLESARACEQGS